MSVQLVTYKKKLADGTIKEYTYEREVKPKAPPKPRKPRARPVSKRVLADIIKTFSTEQLSMLIEYAKTLTVKTDNPQQTPENVPETHEDIEKSDQKSSSTSEDQ